MVGQRDLAQRRRPATLGAGFGGGVECRDMIAETVDQVPVEPPRLRERVEGERPIEAAHHDDPVERLALARKADGTPCSARQPADLEIERGCGPPVERQLGLAGRFAQRRRREIEIGELDRALQLIGAVSGKKHEGNMGLDDVDPLDPGAVGGRLAQKGDDLALPFGIRRDARVH